MKTAAPPSKDIRCYECGKLGHKNVSTRAAEVKRDREGESNPDAQPEIRPYTTSRIASLKEERLVIELLLTIEIEGKLSYTW